MGVIDQCGIQNRNNDGRQYYDKDDDEGNIKKEHIERLKINGNGFQKGKWKFTYFMPAEYTNF